MKTMTCKQLGGPCDFRLHGQTADEVIKAQDKHLKEIVSGGDEAHKDALKDMKGRWKHRWRACLGTSRPSVTLLISRRLIRLGSRAHSWSCP